MYPGLTICAKAKHNICAKAKHTVSIGTTDCTWYSLLGFIIVGGSQPHSTITTGRTITTRNGYGGQTTHDGQTVPRFWPIASLSLLSLVAHFNQPWRQRTRGRLQLAHVPSARIVGPRIKQGNHGTSAVAVMMDCMPCFVRWLLERTAKLSAQKGSVARWQRRRLCVHPLCVHPERNVRQLQRVCLQRCLEQSLE